MLLLSLPALAAFTGGRAPLLPGRALPRAIARGTCMQSSGGGGGATDIFDMASPSSYTVPLQRSTSYTGDPKPPALDPTPLALQPKET